MIVIGAGYSMREFRFGSLSTHFTDLGVIAGWMNIFRVSQDTKQNPKYYLPFLELNDFNVKGK